MVAACVAGCLELEYGQFRLCLLPNEETTVPEQIQAEPRVTVIASHAPGISYKRNLGIAAHPEANYYGWLSFLFGLGFFSAWFMGVVAYAILVGTESLRLSSRAREIPLTMAAVVIGNLAPGLGILMAMVGLRLNLASFYRNQETARP